MESNINIENKKSIQIKPLEQFKQNRKIPISEKLKAIEFSKVNGNKKTAQKFGVTSKSIRRWKKNENMYLCVSNPKKKITLHNGNPNWNVNFELDKQLYNWIAFNRSLGNPVSTWSIGIELIRRNPQKADIKPKSLFSWIYRFLDRNSLSIRSISHKGQQFPKNTENNIFSFLKKIINIRKLYNISTDSIINMDETALQYNMPSNKTVHKIGAKTITINTQQQEKLRISVILAICSNGKKLKPFIIFKGAKKGKIFKNLLKEEYVISKKCIIACNANAWSTTEIIKEWIINVYIPFFSGQELSKTLLVFDHARMHESYEILKLLTENKINYVFIPKGLTPILQPLDVCINYPFKNYIRKEYESAVIAFKSNKVPKIKREILLKWILNVWNDSKKITSEMIKNSFLYCGISNILTGEEDDLFIGWEKINEIGLIENDFSEEDKNDENNNIVIQDISDSEEGSSDLEINSEEEEK